VLHAAVMVGVQFFFF